MNSDIVPQGPTETVTNGTVDRNALMVFAETALVISEITYEFPASPANAGAVTAFTLPVGRVLCRVDRMVFTGTATFIYVK